MATQFQGIVDAYDFAYGVNPNGSGALQVISGSNTAGTYTVTCSPQKLVSADGLPITLSTVTPITIGADSNIETVVPTAVSINGLNQILITAVFANAHNTGDSVRSGSGGIAEAMGYVHASGGGLVEANAANQAIYGTHAQFVTAIGLLHGWANTVLLDYTGANPSLAFSYYAFPIATPADGGVLTSSTHVLY
jgi:hypothetical protein